MSFLAPFFQTSHTFQLRVPSGQAGNAYIFFSLPQHFKNIWPFSFIACWASFLMETPASSYIPSCSCNSATPISHHHCLLGISAFSWPSSRTRRRLRPSSSLDEGELCCGIGVLKVLPLWARRSFRHHSLKLNIMPLVLPTLLLCNFLSQTPNIVFCLPRSGPFLCCTLPPET